MKTENTFNVPHWDENDADIGVYSLVLNDSQLLRFETSERHYRGYSRKPDCKYVLAMCIWGSSHSHNLKAETVESAKVECEKWLTEHLEKRIDSLQESIRYFQHILQLLN